MSESITYLNAVRQSTNKQFVLVDIQSLVIIIFGLYVLDSIGIYVVGVAHWTFFASFVYFVTRSADAQVTADIEHEIWLCLKTNNAIGFFKDLKTKFL